MGSNVKAVGQEFYVLIDVGKIRNYNFGNQIFL